MQYNQSSTAKTAQNKMREAGLWWDNFDLGIRDYRITYVRYRMFLHMRQRAQESRWPQPQLLAYLRKREEECHDWLLHIRDNIETSAKCAIACELAARIYWEDMEGLEISLLTRTDRFERG